VSITLRRGAIPTFGNDLGVREEGSLRRRHCAGKSAQTVARRQRDFKTRTFSAHTAEKIRHPREFQSCLKGSPVPRGRIGHPPKDR
jgi:hypothetical protein